MTAPRTSAGVSGLEQAIGWVLRVGSMVSTAAFATGLALDLGGVGGGWSRVLLTAGLAVLVLTPVTRVVLSVVEYVRLREWPFVAYTLIVLGALVGSVIAGFATR